jgi:hypothetical protein
VPSWARLSVAVCALRGVGDELAVDHVGEPPAQAAHGLHQGLAFGEFAPVVGAAGGVVAHLHDAGHVEHVVQAPVPGDSRGRERSAGTFGSRRDADRAWQQAEVRAAEGRAGDPRRGRQTFRRYVEETWLPNHVIEVSTLEGYTYSVRKHIFPWFGTMRMIDIAPSDVREWVTQLRELGVSPATIRHNKLILSAVFTTALSDQITVIHPCRGVKTPTVPVEPRRIITPGQFDLIYQAIARDSMRLLSRPRSRAVFAGVSSPNFGPAILTTVQGSSRSAERWSRSTRSTTRPGTGSL